MKEDLDESSVSNRITVTSYFNQGKFLNGNMKHASVLLTVHYMEKI